jgi:uncharacterized protein (DUF697 family)/8-oxo-dGTP pyrophosphatase MutT (NUDIX family)
MNVFGLLSTGLRALRPIRDAVRTAELIAEGEGHIAILPGDPEATRRLRTLLGTPAQAPDEDALSILAVTGGTDLAAGGAALARARRRNPRDALAVLIGTRAERDALERELIEEHGLEASNVVHVASLEGPGAEAVIDRVIDVLGDVAVVAGRRTPALRSAIGRRVVATTARQAAAVGAVPLGGAAMPVLTLLQIKMVGQLATLHGRPPLGADRALAALSIMGAGFGWRALTRSAVGFVPGVGWAIQGGVAYGVTRSMGEAVHARLAAGHDMIEGPGVEAIKPQLERVLGRLRRGS